MTDPQEQQTRALALPDQELREVVAALKQKGRAPSTVRGYAGDLGRFEAWARAHDRSARPASSETVQLYLAALRVSGLRASTIGRALAAIVAGHRLDHQEVPVDEETRVQMSGIRRDLGTAPRQARALSTAEIRQMVMACPSNLHGLRDRALILVGFGGGFRRSELVALNVEDVTEDATPGQEGLHIVIGRSKTDQEAKGREVGIRRGRHPHTDAMAALAEWRAAGNVETGALFRSVDKGSHVGSRLSDRAVALIVKIAAARAGLDPAMVSGHSLRAGLATSASRAGATPEQIMRQTGHRSLEMVARYVRAGDLLGSANVGNLLDL
jgi:site-specific recombinase XerD